jgi:hypothetical protein
MANRDPYWLFVKYPTNCSKCSTHIKKGDSAFYYPIGKKLLCKNNDSCGPKASREFQAAVQDEDFYNRQY